MSCKIVYVGAGSYTFGPSVLAQSLIDHDLGEAELALVDVNESSLELMRGVAARLCKTMGRKTRISVHTDPSSALPGADFVICSASPAMRQRFATACRIIEEVIPEHVATEFGGVAGLTNSISLCRFIKSLCEQITTHCPEALLLNVANPLPRVCQAASESGVKTVGFCSASLGVYAQLWRLFGHDDVDYPFSDPREQWRLTCAGLNHFAFLLKFEDRKTGTDLMPTLLDKLRTPENSTGNPRCERFALDTGHLLVPCDTHCTDFLPAQTREGEQHTPWHGDENEREKRLNELREVASGNGDWKLVNKHPSWERPLDLVVALTQNHTASFHSLNLLNTDRHIANLPEHVYVETPATADSRGIHPEQITLPDQIEPYCRHVALVTDTIVRAAMLNKEHLVKLATQLDPSIGDKESGWEAVRRCMDHNDTAI